jgi:hypothetical protein
VSINMWFCAQILNACSKNSSFGSSSLSSSNYWMTPLQFCTIFFSLSISSLFIACFRVTYVILKLVIFAFVASLCSGSQCVKYHSAFLILFIWTFY